jgi:hypothetical protein
VGTASVWDLYFAEKNREGSKVGRDAMTEPPLVQTAASGWLLGTRIFKEKLANGYFCNSTRIDQEGCVFNFQ